MVAGGALDDAVLLLVRLEGLVCRVRRALHGGLLAAHPLMPVHPATGAAPGMLAGVALQPGVACSSCACRPQPLPLVGHAGVWVSLYPA